MTRREFVSLAGGTAVAWPLVAQAQQQAVPIPRIAYLGASSPAILDPRQIEQFKVGLAENGLVDGQNITVDCLWVTVTRIDYGNTLPTWQNAISV
jgi:hypothetical protein